ncbi:MAG: thioredoxin domain-containing protein [Desulfatirhabdiaceae bacterium]
MASALTFMYRCASCRTRNRIPAAHVGKTGKCGKCGAPLATQELQNNQPVILSDSNFSNLILKSPIPAIVDCWAPWCSACKMITPILLDLASKYAGRLRVGKLNVDANPITASSYDTLSIPTLLIFDAGYLRDTLVGALPRHEIVKKILPYVV